MKNKEKFESIMEHKIGIEMWYKINANLRESLQSDIEHIGEIVLDHEFNELKLVERQLVNHLYPSHLFILYHD